MKKRKDKKENRRIIGGSLQNVAGVVDLKLSDDMLVWAVADVLELYLN